MEKYKTFNPTFHIWPLLNGKDGGQGPGVDHEDCNLKKSFNYEDIKLSNMKFSIIKIINFLNQAGRMVAEDLELTVETLRCKEDREAGGLVKKVAPTFFSKV